MTTKAQQLQDWLNGTPTGGPNGDGRYPLTGQDGATYLLSCPAAQNNDPNEGSTTVGGYSQAAAGSATAAHVSEVAAAGSATSASASKVAAAASATAASQSATTASDKATSASNSASTATTKATAADGSAADAANSAGAASGSASAASGSAGTASTKAGEASTSASGAATSKTLAMNYANAAVDVVVEAGKYSAFHWSEKARLAAANLTVTLGNVSGLQGALDAKASFNANVTFRDVRADRGDGTGVIYLSSYDKYLYFNGTDYLFGPNKAWHAGNFNPATKADLTGAAFTGGISAPGVTIGTGQRLFFTTPAGSGWAGSPNIDVNGNRFRFFEGGGNARGAYLDVGDMNTDANSQIWHSGNFDPNGKANLSGAAFTGALASTGSAAEVRFQDRTSGRNWTWYATGDQARLWNGGAVIAQFAPNGAMTINRDGSSGDALVINNASSSPYHINMLLADLGTSGKIWWDGGWTRFSTQVTSVGCVDGQRLTTGWDSGVAGSVSCSNWFRTTGQTGIYFSDYAGGVYMQDTTYVRTYNNKAMVATDFVISSDERLKTGIRPLEYKGRLSPVSYVYKADGKADFGFIAQDVQALYPDAVSSGAGDEHMLKLSYGKLTAVLAHQINHLEDTVARQQTQIDQLLSLAGIPA